ncbi:mechanosensitive ion channel domain-containing protein [Caldovatus sediminis]|nr:mechanosensitive ion channel domain-containing protein [Caldovatus sediminis]
MVAALAAVALAGGQGARAQDQAPPRAAAASAAPQEAPAPPPAPPAPVGAGSGGAPQGAAGAAPASPAAAGAPVPADIQQLLRLLQDDTRRAELIRILEALAAAERGAAAPPAGAPPAREPAAPAPAAPAAAEPALLAPNTLGAQLLSGASQRLSALSDELVAAAQALTDLPAVAAAVSELARDPVTRRRVLDASWKVALVFGLGLFAEWAVWRMLRRPRDALDAMAPRPGSAWNWLRRVPLVVGRLALDLVPIAAFAGVSYGLIGVVQPLPTTQLVMLTANHSYVALRAAMAASRMLLSPASAHLRLVPCSDETAAYVTIWLRRILLVLVLGAAAAEIGLQFGLPWGAYDAILRVSLLAVSLLLVVVILQNRAPVADLLRAPALAEGESPERARRFFRGLRDRFAEVWHLLAILWLFAAWGVWALEIEDGFQRLMRVSAMTLLIAALAKLADSGARRLIGRAFRISPDLAGRYPGLEARANRYLPVLKGIVSGIIVFIALLFLLESWGVDAFEWFGRGQLGNRLLASLVSIGLTVVVAIAAWEAANAAIARHLARLSRDAQAARSARVRTLLPMLRTALFIVIAVFVVLNTLSEIGVNVAPLLAGAGVVGLAIGFGSQKLVQDVITGVFLLFEDAVAVGDVVQLGGLSGVVEQLSIRSIKLRALDGSVHIVPFSAVTTVTNMTRDFAFAVLDLTVSYGADTDKAAEAMRRVAAEMRADPKWGAVIRDDIDVWGVERLSDSGVTVRARMKTDPLQRWNVAREFNGRIRKVFEAEGIAFAAWPWARPSGDAAPGGPGELLAPRRATE